LEWVLSLIDYFGSNPALLILVLFGSILIFFPVNEEFILLIGGYLTAKNQLSPVAPLIAGFVGIVITDVWMYALARVFRNNIFGLWFLRRRKRMIVRWRRKIRKVGPKIIFFARFIPGGARPIAFAACGVSGIKLMPFLFYSCLGAATYMHVSFWIGYFFAKNLDEIAILYKKFETVGKISFLVLVLAVIGYFVYRKTQQAAAKKA
jgi:membrane protein DedA with SNARE-associated domain